VQIELKGMFVIFQSSSSCFIYLNKCMFFEQDKNDQVHAQVTQGRTIVRPE